MSTIEKVCSTCKHYPSDEHCIGCMFNWKDAKGNTNWEPQEPFINKPCVSEQACHEDKMKVLEKIRADVINIADGRQSISVRSVLKIIDKHKGESEDKE